AVSSASPVASAPASAAPEPAPASAFEVAPASEIAPASDASERAPSRVMPQAAPKRARDAKHVTRAEPSALQAESLLLREARAKLAAGDARGALDDVARLEVKHARGRLIQEREIVAIDALVALGDSEAARRRAVAFLARFPQSPYAAHLLERVDP